jgi:hypothetical protein
MKLSESRDSGGRVVFVDVVVFEIAVVFICLGRTAAVAAPRLTSTVIALEKYILLYECDGWCRKVATDVVVKAGRILYMHRTKTVLCIAA